MIAWVGDGLALHQSTVEDMCPEPLPRRKSCTRQAKVDTQPKYIAHTSVIIRNCLAPVWASCARL